jgi:hypothetical protein
MTTLTSVLRGKIPAKKFGIPSERKYPMPDKSHARNAKARASEEYNKGNLSAEMKGHIDKMADSILGK